MANRRIWSESVRTGGFSGPFSTPRLGSVFLLLRVTNAEKAGSIGKRRSREQREVQRQHEQKEQCCFCIAVCRSLIALAFFPFFGIRSTDFRAKERLIEVYSIPPLSIVNATLLNHI